MDRVFGDEIYSSYKVECHKEGYVGFDLNRLTHGTSNRVARVVYWDATGQLFAETFGTDVPVEILEQLISETKASIRIR